MAAGQPTAPVITVLYDWAAVLSAVAAVAAVWREGVGGWVLGRVLDGAAWVVEGDRIGRFLAVGFVVLI